MYGSGTAEFPILEFCVASTTVFDRIITRMFAIDKTCDTRDLEYGGRSSNGVSASTRRH
jgi:hypothetical protein